VRSTHSVRAATACVLFVLAASSWAGVNRWTIKGPPGGDPFRDLEVSSTNPDVYYAAYGRVLARSTDGAMNWQSIGAFTGEVVDVAVDPTDGNRIYVAVLQQGLFRSENGGDSFMQIAPANDMIWCVGVGADDGKTVYYATNSGTFFRSTDRGATFFQRTATFQTISRIQVEGADGSRILALRGPFLARSNDGAATWTEATVGAGYPYSIVRLSPTKLVAATGDGMQLSSDDGATWSRIVSGTYWSVTRDPLSPTTLYAGSYSFGALWRSTNSGASWAPFGAPMMSDARGLVSSASGGLTRLVAATLQGVTRSSDGGTSWTEATVSPVANSPMRMATTLAANSRVFAYTVGDGLFATSNDAPWQRLNLAGAQALNGGLGFGQAAIAIKPGDPRTIYLAAFGRALFLSSDGGANWSRTGATLNNFSVNTLAFDPADSRIMYASLYSGLGTPAANLYRSTDAGASWNPYSVDLPNTYPLRMVVDPADGNRMFIASYQGYFPANTGGLYASTNGGLNWTERGFRGMDVRDVAIDPADSSRVYAATALGLEVSGNGGVTFARNDPLAIVSPLPTGALVLDPVVPSTIYAASTDSGNGFGPPQASIISRSVDRGLSWEVLRAASDPQQWFVGDMILDPNVPSILYVNTGTRGIAAFEVQNDLGVALSGHSGIKPIGASAGFTARVEHHGALAATAARLEIALPAGLTQVTTSTSAGSCVRTANTVGCDFAVLRPGASVDVAVGYVAPAAMALPISASVVAHERDNVAANDAAQASAIAGEVVDLRVTVTPAANTVDHGDVVSYTVQVTNDGPVTASVAALAFVAGSGLTLGAAPAGCNAAGSQLTCVFNGLAVGASRSVAISATASGIGLLSADVAVAAAPSAADANTANNAVVTTISSRPVADLSVTVTDSADPVQTGTAFSYTVAVRNNGPDSAPAATAAITVAGAVTGATASQGTCTIAGASVNCAFGVLASGATVNVTINTSVATAGANTLQATVVGGGTDRTAGDNSAQQVTTIAAPPPPPAKPKGGGGTLDTILLTLGGLLAARRARRAARRGAYRAGA
jgi:uncharacterized repeat protein (TIGR01451 family)